MGVIAALWMGLKLIAGRAWAFLLSLPWQVYAVAALLALAWFYGHWRYNAGQAAVQAEFDAHVASDKQAIDDAARKARSKEAADAASFAVTAAKFATEKEHAQAEIARLSAGLAAGDIKLRQRFTCPSHVPETAAGPGRRDEAGQAGLSNADAEFLVRFAGSADAAAQQLTACQAILTAERSN